MCSAVQPQKPPRKKKPTKNTKEKKKKEAMPHDLSTNNCYEREQKPTAILSFSTNSERSYRSFEKKVVRYCPSIC